MWLDPPPFLDHNYTWMPGTVIRLCHESVGIIPIDLQVNIRSTYYRHNSTSINKLFPAAITATSTLYPKNYGGDVHGYDVQLLKSHMVQLRRAAAGGKKGKKE